MNYSVFFGEKEFVLGKQLQNEKLEHGSIYMTYDALDSLKLAIQLLEKNRYAEKFMISHTNPDELFELFSSLFEKVTAAGGVVKNQNGEYLLIFRNGKWDLPKGKLDAGENIEACAMREVEEECGIKKLAITKKSANTYHIYYLNEKQILKTTYWFEMTCDDSSVLVPQTEEGIEKAVWLRKDEAKKLLSK